MTFSGDKDGQVATVTLTSNAVAYIGTEKVTPTIESVYGAPQGMTVSIDDTVDNEVPIKIAIANKATLGGSGERFGALVVKVASPVQTDLKITWNKVNTGADGEKGDQGEKGDTGDQGPSGDSAVIFTLYAPNGSAFVNGEGTLIINTFAYEGSNIIDPQGDNVSFIWEKYISGDWVVIRDETGNSLEVNGQDVDGIASFRCTMLYKRVEYTDTITLIDKTDPFQAVIESSGGNIFKNTVGESTLNCRLFQSGNEIDPLGNNYTYRWYRLDKDGNKLDGGGVFKTGKTIMINGNDVDIKTTFVCEVG